MLFVVCGGSNAFDCSQISQLWLPICCLEKLLEVLKGITSMSCQSKGDFLLQ